MTPKSDHRQLNIYKKTLSILLETLCYMSKNYHVAGVIDRAAWIISKEDVDNTISQLEDYAGSQKDILSITMTIQDWNRYTRMVDYAGYCAPEQKNRAILDKLYDGYSDSEIFINVELDRHELNIVINVFLQMIEQRDEIDFGMMDLEPFEKFEALIDKMKPYQDSEDSVSIIPMTRDEWSTYTPYVKHANDIVLDDYEGDIMADLSMKYNRINTNYGGNK